MRSAITLSQVPEASGGPFVFHGALDDSFKQAADLGFDAVELFFPGPDFVSADAIKEKQNQHSLDIAAVGTGAGMVIHGWSLTDPDPAIRTKALDFILRMIDFSGALGAPAILGSMQGRWTPGVPREKALNLLAEALHTAGQHASTHGVPFIYEPLNRYETNLFNHLGMAATFLENHAVKNVVLLADLFHMNIEEANIALAIKEAGATVGHVHFADSNRKAVGFGHTVMHPIIQALRSIHYQGYLSAEIFPSPTAHEAAAQTIKAFKEVAS